MLKQTANRVCTHVPDLRELVRREMALEHCARRGIRELGRSTHLTGRLAACPRILPAPSQLTNCGAC